MSDDGSCDGQVVTSQYFSWDLCLVPVCWAELGPLLGGKRAGYLLAGWLSSQGLWLFLAYLLEFQGFQVQHTHSNDLRP